MSEILAGTYIESLGSFGSIVVLMVFLNRKIDKIVKCLTDFKLHIVDRVSKLEGKDGN